MMCTRNSRSGAGWRFVALAAALGAIASCNQPQAPAPAAPSGDFAGTYRPGAGAIEFALDPSTGTNDGLRLEALDLHYDAEQHTVSARVRLRNTGSAPVHGPDAVLVFDFSPPEVRPLNTLSPCDALLPCPPFLFDHRGSYGEDGMLAPGESSEPREWILQNPAGESFAFRARPVANLTGGNGIIAGVVFADLNADGRRDPQETGIAGAPIQLTHGEVTSQTQTDAGGGYRFEVTEEGLYLVTRTAAACRPTTPLQRQVWIVRRPDGSLSGFEHADFGCGPDSTGPRDSLVVEGAVYLDGNHNGHRDPGETGVPAVRVTAGSRCAAPCGGASETVTDEQGRYRFVNPAGCCRLEFVGHDPVPGHIDTSPNPVYFPIPVPGDPTLPPGMPPVPGPGSRLQVDFGVAPQDPNQSVHVAGVVFNDLDRDGQKGPGEPGIAGVLIVGSTPNCPTFAAIEARTDDQGRYTMDLPECGFPYFVQREPLAGFYDTTPNPVVFFGPPPGPGTMPPDRVWDASFGVARAEEPPAAWIEGTVYEDHNRNGVQDAGEPGVADVAVGATSVICLPVPPGGAETRTDAAGHYRLNGADIACPTPWVVRRGAVNGFCDTTPNPVLITAPQGGLVAHVDFGIAACDSTPPSPGFAIAGTVFLDTNRNGTRDRGEPGVPNATLQLLSNCNALWTAKTGADGAYHFDRTQTGCPGLLLVQLTEPGMVDYTTPNPAPVIAPPNGGPARVDFGIARRATP